jgi:hypothetical protein
VKVSSLSVAFLWTHYSVATKEVEKKVKHNFIIDQIFSREHKNQLVTVHRRRLGKFQPSLSMFGRWIALAYGD